MDPLIWKTADAQKVVADQWRDAFRKLQVRLLAAEAEAKSLSDMMRGSLDMGDVLSKRVLPPNAVKQVSDIWKQTSDLGSQVQEMSKKLIAVRS